VLYMVIERYKHGAAPVYERFAAEGRLLPPGVDFIDSWVVDEPEITRCFQLIEADSLDPVRGWMEGWRDLVDFEVLPVIDSARAAARAGQPPG
jgi:phenolic acid decarboxylase